MIFLFARKFMKLIMWYLLCFKVNNFNINEINTLCKNEQLMVLYFMPACSFVHPHELSHKYSYT